MDYILTNFRKTNTSIGKDLTNVLVKQQYELISKAVFKRNNVCGRCVYTKLSHSEQMIYSIKQMPIKKIEVMKQSVKLV